MLSRAIQQLGMFLLSRRLSYLWVMVAELLIVGLAASQDAYEAKYAPDITGFDRVVSWNFLLFLVVLGSILPSRAVLQDWARYAHLSSRGRGWLDYWVNDRAPGLPAVGLHLLLLGGATLSWLFLSYKPAGHDHHLLAQVLINLTLLWVYATLAQLLLVQRKHHGSLWAGLAVGSLILVPPFFALLMPFLQELTAIQFVVSPLIWGSRVTITGMEVLGICTGHLALAAMMQWLAHRQIQRLGASEWRQLSPNALAKG